MIDWERAQRHARWHRMATWVRYGSIIAMTEEVYSVLAYHFPIWADIALPVTFGLHLVAAFVQKHTEMYRID